ncbi:MAG: DNA topoisomerase, partial [Porphyromonadaceae bacterium]|nr:DNA topoisomerase [Porphyromonadaceae bacterium]
MITCIIAEKPSVARDIARIVGANTKQEGYLEGGGYLVTWAMGHLITLAMPEVYGFSTYKAEDLPIRPDPFQLIVRQVRKDKEFSDDPAALKQLKAIRHCFGLAERIIVATDAGREGELIFRMIYQYLDCHKPFDRLWISSLTDKAIREGLAQVRAGRDYDNLYYSAKARSEADWLVGINASRALSIARKGGYSLGRVQTPTLAMVCRRYLENKNFSSVPYWRVNALVEKEGIHLKAISTNNFDNEVSAQTALCALHSQGRLAVSSLTRKVGTTPPPLLYDLTTLQKEANRKYGFSADKTLSIAQSLYEKKVATYPRTGSRYISENVFEEVSAILSILGEGLTAPLNRHSVDNGKVTDHHAIIPTGERALGLSADENTIYQMICTRFIEAFSPNSEEERMQV